MDTVHECDRQTDGRTDRITITKTVQTASHGKNEEKYRFRNSENYIFGLEPVIVVIVISQVV